MTSWSSQQPAQSTISTAQVHSGAQSLRLANNGGTYQVGNANVVPVSPGWVFLFQAWAMTDAAITSGTLGLRVIWLNAAGALGVAIDTVFTPTASWEQYSTTVTIPAGAVAVQCAIISWSPVGGNIYVDDCYFRRMDDASLIVDGSITASKIAAGAITANMITTGTLNAADVDVVNLNASNITAGTLAAQMVVFSDGTDLTTASRVQTSTYRQTATATTSGVTVPGTAISGLSFSVTSSGATDVFNIFGSLSGGQTGGTVGDQCYINLYIDGSFNQQASVSYPTLNGTQSSLIIMSVTGLSAGTHTFAFYLEASTSVDTFQSYVGTTLLLQRIF